MQCEEDRLLEINRCRVRQKIVYWAEKGNCCMYAERAVSYAASLTSLLSCIRSCGCVKLVTAYGNQVNEIEANSKLSDSNSNQHLSEETSKRRS